MTYCPILNTKLEPEDVLWGPGESIWIKTPVFLPDDKLPEIRFERIPNKASRTPLPYASNQIDGSAKKYTKILRRDKSKFSSKADVSYQK